MTVAPTGTRLRRSRTGDHRGSAVVEFVAVVVVLLVPLAVALSVVARVGVARMTAAATAGDSALAVAGGHLPQMQAVAAATRTWPAAGRAEAEIRCRPGCAVPGGLVTATVTVRVPLAPLPGEATVSAERTQPVDRHVPR